MFMWFVGRVGVDAYMLAKLVSALSLVQNVAGKEWLMMSKQGSVTQLGCYLGHCTCRRLAWKGGDWS